MCVVYLAPRFRHHVINDVHIFSFSVPRSEVKDIKAWFAEQGLKTTFDDGGAFSHDFGNEGFKVLVGNKQTAAFIKVRWHYA